jgi:hypothetical protein
MGEEDTVAEAHARRADLTVSQETRALGKANFSTGPETFC